MHRLFEAFEEAGKELYLVGGAVRDLAMGGSVSDLDDLDFTTNARPEETLQILDGARIRTYELGIEFGTVGAVLTGPRGEGYPKDVQITTYRSAEYYRRGSRHPVVCFGDTIEQDLARRDFSINSMAMGSDGGYFDPYGGLRDIESKTLRVVGDPNETLAEDPLRILRIARFMARFSFAPSAELRDAAYRQAQGLLQISQQRWLQEMNKILVSSDPATALRFLVEVRAMGVLLPEVMALVGLHRRWPDPGAHTDYWQATLARVERAGDDLAASWAALLLDTGRASTRFTAARDYAAEVLFGACPAEPAAAEPDFPFFHRASALLARGVAHRFHFDSATATSVEEALRGHTDVLAYDDEWTEAQIRGLVRDLGKGYRPVLTFAQVVAGEVSEAKSVAIAELVARLEQLERDGRLIPSLPAGLGRELMGRLALSAGPALGEALSWLREEIIEGRLLSDLDPEAYVNYLEQADPEVLTKARQHRGPSRGRKPPVD